MTPGAAPLVRLLLTLFLYPLDREKGKIICLEAMSFQSSLDKWPLLLVN